MSIYDLSQLKRGVKGKYAQRYNKGTDLVLSDPDVAELFPDDRSVDDSTEKRVHG